MGRTSTHTQIFVCCVFDYVRPTFLSQGGRRSHSTQFHGLLCIRHGTRPKIVKSVSQLPNIVTEFGLRSTASGIH